MFYEPPDSAAILLWCKMKGPKRQHWEKSANGVLGEIFEFKNNYIILEKQIVQQQNTIRLSDLQAWYHPLIYFQAVSKPAASAASPKTKYSKKGKKVYKQKKCGQDLNSGGLIPVSC